MIKIDLEKCEFQFGDFVLTRDTKVADLLKRDDIFRINMVRYQNNIERNGGVQDSAIVYLKENLVNNGIAAKIQIAINEKFKSLSINITPTEAKSHEELVQMSKQWLRGVVIGEYNEKEDSVSGGYDWGYMCASLRPDRDYGINGGEILIRVDL